MDRSIKVLLGIIAASLVALNLQLAGVSLVGEAHAGELGMQDFEMITRGLSEIASAIRISCG